jgi:hypothetical protein
MTNSDGYRDSAVMMSSAIPSEKNSWRGSPLMLVKGRTATEGLSGNAGEEVATRFVPLAT